MNRERLASIAWMLVVGLAAMLVASNTQRSRAEDEAMRERGRVVELTRQREIAEAEASTARAYATAMGDSAEIARQYADSVARDADRKRAAARQAATDAEARVRATLDSLGASTGDVDVLVAAHEAEIAALTSKVSALTFTNARLTTYAESLAAALEAETAVSAGLRLERDSYARQAEAWRRSRPGWLDRTAKIGGAVAVGYAVGRLTAGASLR